MIKLVVAAIILVIIMIFFVFILFKNIIKRINDNAKTFFVNKMQDYDYILDEKKEKLSELTKEIEEIEEKKKNSKYSFEDIDDIVEESQSESYSNDVSSVKYNLNVPQYRETQFFKNYKEIKRIFSVNNEQIIKEFIEENRNSKEETEYKKLKKIRDKFNDEAIYGCLTLDEADQKEILNEVLTETEKKLLKIDTLTNKEKFSIGDFVNVLDKRIEELDPTIYVFVNGNSNGYEDIAPNIVVEQYKNISEGIIIKYRDKIYDYSI